MHEQLQFLDKATPPPRYITHTPVLFEAWYDWYETLPDTKQEKTSMKPMGTTNAPDWCQYEFKGLEEFYKHYTWLTKEVD